MPIVRLCRGHKTRGVKTNRGVVRKGERLLIELIEKITAGIVYQKRKPWIRITTDERGELDGMDMFCRTVVSHGDEWTNHPAEVVMMHSKFLTRKNTSLL